MKYLILIFILFSSCFSAKKSINKLKNKSPYTLAEYCATVYPCEDSIFIITNYIEGETIFVHDTIQVKCDSAKQIIKVPCPPSKHRVDTFYKDKIVYQTDKAKIDLFLKSKDSLINKLTKEITLKEEFKNRLQKSNKAILITYLLLAVLIFTYSFIKFKK